MAGRSKKAGGLTDAPIHVEIGGQGYDLEVTLAAVRTICRLFGGVRPAFRQVQDINVSTMAGVILAGSGTVLKDQAALDAFETAVLKGDLAQIGGACTDFLAQVLAGGIAAPGDEAGDGRPGKG
ncbi:MAG: hypothetical protein R8L07_03420 [Alphaproteobacteria bacterium]|nr:hypothetical protein [Alphaproteobacteria bacterium]